MKENTKYSFYCSYSKQNILLDNCTATQVYESADWEMLYIQILQQTNHQLNQFSKVQPTSFKYRGKNKL